MKFCKKLLATQLIKNSNVVGFKCKADDETILDVKSIYVSAAGYATLTFQNESEQNFKTEDFKLMQEAI